MMNRPNINHKWQNERYSVISPVYVRNLEKYCDELEHKAEINRLTIDCLVDSNEKYKKIIEMYEKELKKDEQRSLVSDDEKLD